MDTAETVITAVMPLIGVAIGAWLTDLQHRRNWRRERESQLGAVRRQAYGEFMTAARTWQSNVLEPNVRIETSHRGVPYVDAGSAYGDTIRGLTELRLLAGSSETISAAIAWEQALRDLSSARAATNGPVENSKVRRTKAAEGHFLEAARRELTDRMDA